MNDNTSNAEQLNPHTTEQILALNKRRENAKLLFGILFSLAFAALLGAGNYSYQAITSQDPLSQIFGGFSVLAALTVILIIAKAQARSHLTHVSKVCAMQSQTE